MGEPLENLYFNWLYAKVCDVRANTPSRKFETLLGELHRIEFVWLISGDDNRAEDGLDLRSEFMANKVDCTEQEAQYLFMQPCSVFEMLIGLARRAEFQSDESASFWFWKMLENVGLSELHDGAHIPQGVVLSVVEKFIWRQYPRSGMGGLFPLIHTRHDQRKVDLWYQMSEYMDENDFG